MIFFKILIFVLIFLNVIMISMEDPLVLGVLVLLNSFLVAFFSSFMISSWFSLIFFLMYVGGILVLMFYSLILKSNPMVIYKTNKKFFICFVVSFFWLFWGFKMVSFKKNWEAVKMKLWSFEETKCLLGVFVVLLVVLWMISKILFSMSGAFRPLF